MKDITSDILGLIRIAVLLSGLIFLGVGAVVQWGAAGLMAPGLVLIILAILGELISLRAATPVVVPDTDA